MFTFVDPARASTPAARSRQAEPTVYRPLLLRRGYGRRAILCIILRNLPPECRCLRSFVTSDGMGGTVSPEDERGPVVAGYGYGYGAAGSVMTSSLGLEGPPQRLRRPLASGPPRRCDGEIGGGRAGASRYPAGPASAAGSRGRGRPISC